MTRLARTTPRSVCTIARSSLLLDPATGACRATMSPSWSASRSGTSWEPPTKRRSCAPLAVSELREKVPTFCSLPEHATYQSVKSRESSSGSAPKPGWVQRLIRFSTPAALTALARMHSPRRHRVPLGGAGVPPRRVDRDLGGDAVDPGQQHRGVGEDRRVGRDGAGVLQPAGQRGDVDAARRSLYSMNVGTFSPSASAGDVVLGRADERATGLDRLAAARPTQRVVEHPAADSAARLDAAARRDPLRASLRAATSPEMPAPTTTASTCRGSDP